MPRRVRDTGLESRAARGKLKPRGKPYFKAIAEGLHVGYRKGAVEGKWVVRRYVGNQSYVVETIATADDTGDADGLNVLTFWQAQDRARELAGKKVYGGPYRVRDAVEAYLTYLGDRATGYDGRIRFEKHVLPVMGDEHVGELTAEQIREWHRDLAQSLPLIPKKRTGISTRQIDLDDPEQARKRQVSANRVLAILKAALNMAFRDGKVSSDSAWRRVEPFEGVERSRNRYLTLAECERLLNAAEENFRPLVRGGLETGARYGELCRLQCVDYNPDSGTVHIRKSKTGKERHIILTAEGQEFFGQLVAGRASTAPMFGREWKPNHQFYRMRRACAAARIDPPIGFHQLRHTWASLAVMSGMPLAVVAQNLGHSDTIMTERHYRHLAPSYVVDQVRKHAPKFGLGASNVKAIR
jgi:integrase